MSRTSWKRTVAKSHPLVCLLLLTSFAGLRAEPVIFLRAVLNAASFMPPGVPGGSIAPRFHLHDFRPRHRSRGSGHGVCIPSRNHLPERFHLNYAQIHFASVAAFVAGWRSS